MPVCEVAPSASPQTVRDRDEGGTVSPTVTVRPAEGGDFPAVAAIVNGYIAATTVNFRTEPQTAEDWTADWYTHRERFPWLVAADGDTVLGVAYATPWKSRNAYDWCAEVTAYVAPESRGRRVGHDLYRGLLAILDAQGFRTQVAVVGLPNPASAGFHESFGFHRAGTLTSVGYKHGTWCDVGFWQRVVEVPGETPVRPRPVAEVMTAVLDRWATGGR
jgi:phosphinothricin acetyltransferase